MARYREVAEVFLQQEDPLEAALRPRGEGAVVEKGPGEAPHGLELLAPPPADETFSARLRELLPADWREDVKVVLAPGGFVVGFRDSSGVQHELRAHWQEDKFSAIAHGSRF